MALPLLAVAGASALAQGVGGLLGKKKVKSPDYSGLINTLNASGEKQRGLITGLRPKLEPLANTFTQDRTKLSDDFVTNISGQSNKFVQDSANAATELGEAEGVAGRRRILETQPELQNNLREALAGSGLNRGGAAVAGATKINQELGRQVGELESNIGIQSLQGKQQAVRDAFQANAGAAEKALGINAETVEKIFATGREDLITEMLQLLQEEQSRTQTVAGLQGQQLTNDYTAQLARRQNNQDLLSTLLGGASMIGGAALAGGGAPAAPSMYTPGTNPTGYVSPYSKLSL